MGDRRVGRALVAMLVVAAAVASSMTGAVPRAAQARAAAPPEAPPTRVMVLGDSLSHASVGDRSWRYFAWRHLVASGASVDFVGPFREPYRDPVDTWPAVYADPAFDQDHASVWGDSFTWPRHDWASSVQWTAPDVVVLALGTNDLVFFGLKPAAVIDLVRTRLAGLRALRPEVDVVLVEAGRPDVERVRRYNSLLPQLALESSTAASRVVVARLDADYRMGKDDDGVADTFDTVHPNTRGQVKFAAAVTDALARIGVGRPYPRPLAFPAEGPRVVPVVRARARRKAADLRWSVPPGATSYDVWVRGPGQRWKRRVRAHPTPAYRLRGLESCRPHQVKVRARKGWTVAAPDVAGLLTVRVGPRVSGRPAVEARGGNRRVTLGWQAVKGACTYEVRAAHLRAGSPVTTRRVVTGRRVVLRRLPAGTAVTVRVRALGAQGEGRWSSSRVVRTR